MARGSAVVVGGSVAGLLAARALSDRFEQVTVFDRDALPPEPRPHTGVPQGRQVHALLHRGAETLGALLPGFLDDLKGAGVPTGDGQRDHHMYLDGHLIVPAASGLTLYGASRSLIEYLIRTRVTALPNVAIVDGTAVTGLVLTGDGERVAGVRPAGAEEVRADLVVDATGRGSHGARWLREAGAPVPPTSAIRADVVYVTRHYARRPEHLNGLLGATIIPYPGMRRGGVVVRQEGDRFAIVLAGMLGEEPPLDEGAYAAWARSLPSSEVADVIDTSEPLDEPAKMRFRQSVRHHFERLDAPPAGFLAVGDALCDFNPVYGQGMTVAAMEAELLRDLLAGEEEHDLPRRFFAAAAKVVDGPWQLAAGGDYRFPEVEGRRPALGRLVERYLDRYRAAASVDPVLGTRFLHVAHLMAPPSRLLSPPTALRVMRARPGRRASR
ncbi:NAD(P)/FAD-dependent oxidoreductase [Streptomyces sp. TS71-3]|uniref:FAD-dependent oxidoreductase n=1 Tax=Streptomyces sp. TS71-3 TaxID=2733862 RepID=UPI001B00FD7A|nr:monooxygenase [Streptomyces sp. TS71-3]GHJ39406.1 FAD-binding monooxygenase [Streptomyces sp. TS71-3]